MGVRAAGRGAATRRRGVVRGGTPGCGTAAARHACPGAGNTPGPRGRAGPFGGDSEKWGKLNNPEFASARRLAPLFEALEKAQTADDSDSDASDDDGI